MFYIILWVLGALYVLTVIKSTLGIIYYQNIFLQEWFNIKPIRIDKELSIYKYIEAHKLTRYHQEIIKICKILNIKVPKTYLVGDMGIFQRARRKGHIVYKRKPLVVIYYDASDKWMFTVAHEMYHAYQRAQCPKRFTPKGILCDWIEQCELEAQAFAVAFMESKYPSINIEPREWEHSAISEEVTQNRNEKDEIVVIRAMADEFKKKYFAEENSASHSCTKCS